MSEEPAISAVDLVKKYGEVTALAGLSFSVPPGTVFGLLGPNGAGKSTTIKILTTLSRPTSGSATVAGIDVLTHPNDVRRVIGVVTQGSGTDRQATGRENLLLAAHIQGMRGGAARARVDELLELFSLTEAAKRIVKQYSGGMQRKLDVAMGLVHRPAVLFLDEPTTGLDPQARAEMWAEIARLARHERLTILLTTHYLEEADHLADQLAIVDKGGLVAQGSPEELKSELRGDAGGHRPVPGRVGARRAHGHRGVGRGAGGHRYRPYDPYPGGSRRFSGAGGARRTGEVGGGGGGGDRRTTRPRRRLSATHRPDVRVGGSRRGGPMTTLAPHTGFLTQRMIMATLRQPAFVVIMLIQPMIWLLLFGQLFKRVVEIPGFATGSYIDFLTPGVVVMTVLFTSGWAGMAFIDDMDRGVMDRMLSSPVSRGALMLASVANQAVTIVVQGAVVVAVGLALGASFPGGILGVLVMLLASVLLAAAFACLSNGMALIVRTSESADRVLDHAAAAAVVPVLGDDGARGGAGVDPDRVVVQPGRLDGGRVARGAVGRPGLVRRAAPARRVVRGRRGDRLDRHAGVPVLSTFAMTGHTLRL
ncbi:MAG: ATP-binding cassette domain-containing protein [Pseudonocardiaceae bacterium]|nr:ATP-binding cassette domain-containing protein [Pseudonocardiaceae bacterium]